MEFIVLIIIAVLAAPLALSIAAYVKSAGNANGLTEVATKLFVLEKRIERMERQREAAPIIAPPPAIHRPEPVVEKKAATPPPEPIKPEPVSPPAPALPVAPPPPPEPIPEPAPQEEHALPEAKSTVEASLPGEVTPDEIEQFMGVKLFAWIGGLALFLAIAFFIKYSFEHNLIPPWLRIASGYVAALGLVAGGLALRRKNYGVTAQTLCATGVLSLYGVTYASHALYQFTGDGLTFLLMSLITVGAFLLAVQMEAAVIAVLGIAGGFLTPVLLSSRQDNPFALFSYIALLDAGLLAVAIRREWRFLAALGAVGTLLMEYGWLGSFFFPSGYDHGTRVFIPMEILLLFPGLFLLAIRFAGKSEPLREWVGGAGIALTAAAFLFAAFLASQTGLAMHPWTLFGFLFVADALVLAFSLVEKKLAGAHLAAGGFAFLLLTGWMQGETLATHLSSALALILIFAAFHTLAPIALKRLRGLEVPWWCSQVFPVLGILMVLNPVWNLPTVPLTVWPVLFVLDAVAFGLAVLSGYLFGAALAVILTFAGMWMLIGHAQSSLQQVPTMLILTGIFSVVFFGVALVVAKTKRPAADAPHEAAWQHFPLLVVLMPFALLLVVVTSIPLPGPNPVFALAAFLLGLLLLTARWQKMDWLPLLALIATWGLEAIWQQENLPEKTWLSPLLWFLAFHAAFTVFPFCSLKRFAGKSRPWTAAALSGGLHFLLVYRLTIQAAPSHPWIGLLPLAFALPPLVSGLLVAQRMEAEAPARLKVLAQFFGSALGFGTLAMALQFHREWMTIGWALEGTALCWLYRRLPHPGLRLTGIVLLLVAFARLVLNPAVLEYHSRSATPLFNWYLSAYGLVIVAFLATARLLAPPHHQLGGFNLPAICKSLATLLAFALLNIEIADYFTEPGASVLTFDFAANLARDMSYSIGWALFALGLVTSGLIRRQAASRYAGLLLLGVTLLKLFFHDLTALGQLYRIGALFAVAVIAILASFLYQYFLNPAKEAK
ncbi:MAG: DUF2339 domain-containing protein [Chthoniobacteraceae bacterium]